MSEWKPYKLEHVIDSANTGLDAIQRAPIVQEDTGIRCLRIQDISQNKDFENWGFTKVREDNFKRFQLHEGDLIIARTGETVGVNKYIDKTYQSVYNNGLIRIRFNKDIIFPKFGYYQFQTDRYKGHINVAARGTSTQPNMKIQALLDFEFSIPEMDEQQEIASILSSLDDKIELNLQMNQTLEAMAQAIFKEWFVNFNFFGFDGELVDGLPKGWRIGKLGEIVDVKGGTTPSTTVEEYWNGEYYWSTPKDLSNIQSPVLLDTERKITEAGVKQISSGIMPAGTLLLSSRAPIGYLAISQVPISINQGYIAIQGKFVSNLFMLFWLKQNMDSVKVRANGSTFQEISKGNFKEIEISIPGEKELELFDGIVNPIFGRMVANEIEIKTLSQIRDSLLPKLMTGKISLNHD